MTRYTVVHILHIEGIIYVIILHIEHRFYNALYMYTLAVFIWCHVQVTQMKIKNNPFAKAFLGGNASER